MNILPQVNSKFIFNTALLSFLGIHFLLLLFNPRIETLINDTIDSEWMINYIKGFHELYLRMSIYLGIDSIVELLTFSHVGILLLLVMLPLHAIRYWSGKILLMGYGGFITGFLSWAGLFWLVYIVVQVARLLGMLYNWIGTALYWIYELVILEYWIYTLGIAGVVLILLLLFERELFFGALIFAVAGGISWLFIEYIWPVLVKWLGPIFAIIGQFLSKYIWPIFRFIFFLIFGLFVIFIAITGLSTVGSLITDQFRAAWLIMRTARETFWGYFTFGFAISLLILVFGSSSVLAQVYLDFEYELLRLINLNLGLDIYNLPGTLAFYFDIIPERYANLIQLNVPVTVAPLIDLQLLCASVFVSVVVFMSRVFWRNPESQPKMQYLLDQNQLAKLLLLFPIAFLLSFIPSSDS